MKRDDEFLSIMVSELISLQVLALQLNTGDQTLKLLGGTVSYSTLVFTKALELLAEEMGVSEDATLKIVDEERDKRIGSLKALILKQALHPTGKLDG